MQKSDNIYANDAGVTGVNPWRGTAPVRRFMRRDLVLPSNLVAAALLKEHSGSGGGQRSFLTVSMQDVAHMAKKARDLGVRAIKIFVHSDDKDDRGSSGTASNSSTIEVLKRVKDAVPELCVITDTCLCSYTTHGNCVLHSAGGTLDLEGTIDSLAELAMRQVEAGADIIGPAAMLDGAVSRIKEAIQAHANRPIPIMPNLTLRSCLYRTYRTEMRTGAGTQRQAFQIDPTRPEQYFSMGRQMAREGADLLMLQPGLFSLDLIAQMKAETSLPVGIYSVSGEFSMFRALSKNDEEFFDILIEHATASRRAGSDFIVTYAWREIAEGHSRYIA